MKKIIILCSVICCCTTLYAQEHVVYMNQFMEIKVGTAENEILFADSMHTGCSPVFLTVVDGKFLWVGEDNDIKVIDIFKRKIINTVVYTTDPFIKLSYGSNPLMTQRKLFQWMGYGEPASIKITREPFTILDINRYGRTGFGGNYYMINDFVFIYHDDKLAYAINPDGAMLSNSNVKKLLLEWLDVTWYPTQSEKEFHRELIETGKYVIANGIFYPASGEQLYEYFKKKGGVVKQALDILKINGGSLPPAGISLNGDMYIASKYILYVINQDGDIKGNIDTKSIDVLESDPYYSKYENWGKVSPLLIAVHPNGNIYAMQAIKDKTAKIFKAEKTWGNDLVGMARKGINSSGDKETRNKLNLMSNAELSLLKNTLFALHGYEFESYELSCYFNGYAWYKPDSTVKNDPKILSADQKRLFDVILEIESARKASL